MHWELLIKFSCNLHKILHLSVYLVILLVVLTSSYYNTYRVKSTKKPCIRINIRKLNRVTKYNVSYLYILYKK